MARTGHPSSCVAAILRVMPLRKGSVLDAEIVSCRYIASRETLMLCFVRNYLEKERPNCLSISR